MKLILLLFTFLISLNFIAQKKGNEWINYNQKYYEFKILDEGIYRIDYSTLAQNGINTKEFKPSNIQIFGKEKEHPIIMFDGGDNSFDAGDYLLFFAEKNDCWLDSTLYEDPNTIGNPGKSLFSDTISYFFTWNNKTNNLRYSPEFDNNFSNYPTQVPYVISKYEYWSQDSYNPAYNESGIAIPQFSPGEGFCSGMYNGGGNIGPFNLIQFPLYINNVYQGANAPQSIFHSKFNSLSNAEVLDTNGVNPNKYNHHLRLKIGEFDFELADTIFKGYKQIIVNKEIPTSFLGSNGTTLKWEIVNDLNAKTDYQTFSYLSLIYPKLPTLEGKKFGKFIVNNQVQSKINLTITNTSITSPIMLVTGDTKPKYIFVENGGNGSWKALISPSTKGNTQQVVIQDVSLIDTVFKLKAVNNSGIFTDYSMVNFDSSNIIIYHPALLNASIQYKQYREQKYNVVFVNIEELYLQFSGGVSKHNAALRRFGLFAYNKATIKPLAITLLGKGYNPSVKSNTNYIPCFGNPGSDICFTSNLLNSGYAPLIPIGRISVNTEQSLLDYLEKLKSYERQQDPSSVYNSSTKDWQKQILHFSGGNEGSQQNLFFNYMESFRYIIENKNFAGKVTTFRKISSNPLDPTLIGELSQLLAKGVSLMTFFGHSNVNTFDISIDEPENWNNSDKYPVVVGNGCYTGDIYKADGSFGEKLIRTPNKGAIAYIGSTEAEFDISVFKYCRELYNQFSNESYGAHLGEQIKKTIERLQFTESFNTLLKGTFGSTNLNGDPLIKLNWHAKPEIEFTEQAVFFKPDKIDLTVDSIEVNMIVKNLGKAISDTFNIEIKRDFPNSLIDSIYSLQYTNLNYIDTIKYKIPLQPNLGIGTNWFDISIDIPSNIAEQYDEINNNKVSIPLHIKVDALLPVFPFDLSIVPYDTVTLRASTLNPIAKSRLYHFELDTTDAFNSPEKRFYSTTELGGVKQVKYDQWKDINGANFPLKCKDSVVYFWRTAVDSSVLSWNESSFQYIKGKEGWSQDHFSQFKNNDFITVKYDKPNRKRVFEPVIKKLDCRVYDKSTSLDIKFAIDNQQQDYGTCWGDPSIHLVVIDPITLKPWKTVFDPNSDTEPGHYLYNTNHAGGCRKRQELYFVFRQDSLSLKNLDKVLNTMIPNGHYVLLFAINYPVYQNWDLYCPELYQTFNKLGSKEIKPGLPARCFAFTTQIGSPNLAKETIASSDYEIINHSTDIKSGDYLGQEKTNFIGPSREWKSIHWKQYPLESNIGDTTQLTIELYNKELALSKSIDTIFTRNDSIINLSSLIDAKSHPYIKLKSSYLDYINFTPSQIDKWQILYTPVPEAALDGTSPYTWIPFRDSLIEGENFKFAIDVKNISDYPMDSLLVNYWVEDNNRVKHFIPYLRQDSLRVFQTLRDTIQFSTIGLTGMNSLWMEVNPYVNGSKIETDQIEKFHFNNLVQIPFFVKGDDINPILDVTFNGRHILNRDIIDPTSEIVISLKDDNPFLIMNEISDTTRFGVFLTSPDGTQKRIPFLDGNGNTIMQWYPAEANYKKFKIIYPANFEKDGIYTLLVQGTDRSGNLSGDLDYKISFEVIHESSITYMMNYPNPFSTSTRFVFTLTGSKVPEDFLIQILTVSGKVVKQINEDELGPIFIGRNITEYEWNGTDDFGDPLANGVYIYRVLSKLDGEEIKHRETNGDKYFTKEYGKMYLMR